MPDPAALSRLASLRRATRRFALLAAVCAAGCSRTSIAPDASGTLAAAPYRLFQLDHSPTWSPSGTHLCFRRGIETSYGPPGIYLIAATGGTPRFVVGSGLFYPSQLTFSPNGRCVAGVNNGDLVLVDLAQAQMNVLVSTPSFAFAPDWSPDGSRIVYTRVFVFPDAPPESSGVHIYEIASGLDRLVTSSGAPIEAQLVRFSPDGTLLAAVVPTPGGSSLVVYDLEADTTAVVVDPPASTITYDMLDWRRSPITGANELL